MKKIIILGGGVAGLTALKVLAKAKPDAELVLVDHVAEFSLIDSIPGMWQYSGSDKEQASHISFPALAKQYKFTFIQGDVGEVNLDQRKVRVGGAELIADILVLALGSHHNLELVSVSPILLAWTREQLSELGAWLTEVARQRQYQQNKESCRVAIVGGGVFGVQLAVDLALLVNSICANPARSNGGIELVVYEKSGSLLHLNSAETLRIATLLRGLGVRIKFHSEVKSVNTGSLVFKSTSSEPVDLTIWAGGRTGEPFFKTSHTASNFYSVNHNFQVRGYPKVFCIGDQALAPIPHRLPSLFEAVAEGKYVGLAVLEVLRNHPLRPYTAKGLPYFLKLSEKQYIKVLNGKVSFSIFNKLSFKNKVNKYFK